MKSCCKHSWPYLLMLVMSVWYTMGVKAGIIHRQDFSASDFDVWTMTAPNGHTFSKVSGKDMFVSGEIGQPEITYKVIRFLVPDNAYDFKVTVEDIGVTSPFLLDNAIYPVQKAVPINDYNDDMFTFPDKEEYRNLKTSFRAEILDESRLEGRYHIVSVGLWPFVYSGNEKEFELCTSLSINLDYKENTLFKQKSSTSYTKGFINISDIVVNAEHSQSTAPQSISVSGIGNTTETQDLPRYYIISERNLLPACEDLATWKSQKGYYVVTKAIEDIYEDTRYKVGTNGIVDEAASLRKYLQDEFFQYGTFFCFLVGDHHTRMPIRKVYYDNPHSSTNVYEGDKYIPTDIYFSNLSENEWNIYKDQSGFFVDDYENVSFNLSIYVGRLLAHTPEHVRNYTSKLILYECNPGRGNSDYIGNASMFVQIGTNSTYPTTIQKLSNTFEKVETFLDSKISSEDAVGYPTGELMLKKINESGYLSLSGHGEPSTLACSGRTKHSYEWQYIKALASYQHDSDPVNSQTNITNKCDNNSLDLLNNINSPSVIYTVSCTTTPYDVYNSGDLIFDVPHTIASSYTVGGLYGGVAYLGNTRSGYSGSSATLEQKFLDEIISYPKVGMAEAISKYKYIGDKRIRNAHNLIGDPEFELWLNKPSCLLDVRVSWSETDISVCGSDAMGSTVIINDGTGGIRSFKNDESQPSFVEYPGGGKMEALGIFRPGFLPIVKINCFADKVENCNKKFIVRDASLGCVQYGVSPKVTIASDAYVRIRAVDSIETGSSLYVSQDGALILQCDKDINLGGSHVETGGTLTAKGKKVVLSNGFCVNSGGSLAINQK